MCVWKRYLSTGIGLWVTVYGVQFTVYRLIVTVYGLRFTFKDVLSTVYTL